MQVVIDANTIITAGAVLSAIVAIGGALLAVHRWYLKQENQSEKIAELEEKEDKAITELEEKHEKDTNKMEQELCLLTYGVLACLKGLKEQGCNGPVSEAIVKIEKHINVEAHKLED